MSTLRDVHAKGVEIPSMWNLAAGPTDPKSPDQVALNFGLNNNTGALEWNEGDASLVPCTGTNIEWTTYYLAGMHDTPVPPHAEVPTDIVFAALQEFLRTGERPTCLEWTESAPITTLSTTGTHDGRSKTT